VCFVSTHLDDVVLSCSHLVARHPGAVVVTVCAGAPDGPAGLWDRLTTGRVSAREAVAVRRAEDEAALAQLGATPHWLDLFDGQYGPKEERDREPIAAAIAAALDQLAPAVVYAPMGLVHPDHVAVSDACLLLAGQRREPFFLYVDMPYAQTFPARLGERLDDLRIGAGDLRAVPPLDLTLKRRTATAYGTQLRWVQRATGFEASMTDDELYWRAA